MDKGILRALNITKNLRKNKINIKSPFMTYISLSFS